MQLIIALVFVVAVATTVQAFNASPIARMRIAKTLKPVTGTYHADFAIGFRHKWHFSDSHEELNVSVKVAITDEEPIENTLKRFKRLVNQSGHLMELRFKEQWETSADRRKRKSQRAKQLDRIEKVTVTKVIALDF